MIPYPIEVNKVLNPTKMMQEIHASSISVCVIDVQVRGSISVVNFKTTLSDAERTIFFDIANNHDPTLLAKQEPMDASITEVPDYAAGEVDKSYRVQSWEVDITDSSAEGPYAIPIQFQYPVVFLGGGMGVNPDMRGDRCKFEVHFSPQTGDVVGQLIQNVEIGRTSVNINAEAAMNYVFKGFKFFITDGAAIVEELGEVLDKVGNTIIFEKPITREWSAGAYIKSYFELIPHFYFSSSPFSLPVGDNTHRGMYVPKGGLSLFKYWNDSKVPKQTKPSLYMEFYI